MAKNVNKKELGLGIRALLSNLDQVETPEKQEEVVRELSHTVAMIPVVQIEVNPFQPRKDFDEEALEELAHSLKVHGLIQPITVRRLSGKEYQLISGERRLRASRLAGLTEIPAYVRIANDQEMLEMALVENIQREDLNPIEISITYQRLIDECNLTHENLGDRVGKKRSTVTNFLGLLKLPPQIQQALKNKDISMGHAKALRGIEDVAIQLSIFNEIISKGLSVRDAEQLARDYQQPKVRPKSAGRKLSDSYLHVQDNLRNHFGAKVQIKTAEKGKGQIVIPFSSDEDFNRLLDLLEKS
jgi:ParB family transcriptional regulator, chromosome partitioning protein